MTVDHIADFGVLRKGLDKDDIKALQPNVQEELAVYEDDLDEEGAKELFDDGDSSKRRKRATTGTFEWFVLSFVQMKLNSQKQRQAYKPTGGRKLGTAYHLKKTPILQFTVGQLS